MDGSILNWAKFTRTWRRVSWWRNSLWGVQEAALTPEDILGAMDHPPIFSSRACPCFSTPPEICSSRSGEVMFWGILRFRHLRIWADCNPWEVNIPNWIIRRLQGCTCGVIDILLYACIKSLLSWIKTSQSLGLRKNTARTSPEQQRKTQRSRSKLGRPGSVMYLAKQKVKTKAFLGVSL